MFETQDYISLTSGLMAFLFVAQMLSAAEIICPKAHLWEKSLHGNSQPYMEDSLQLLATKFTPSDMKLVIVEEDLYRITYLMTMLWIKSHTIMDDLLSFLRTMTERVEDVLIERQIVLLYLYISSITCPSASTLGA